MQLESHFESACNYAKHLALMTTDFTLSREENFGVKLGKEKEKN